MGQYLKTELTSDQLELHLAGGKASLHDVKLNTEYINEALEAAGIKVVSLNEGYIQTLTVSVPWKNLLRESTEIKVSGLQITLTPLAVTSTQDLVNSVIDSIASSMDLAKSVHIEQLSSETDNVGIEYFASIIDQIISRIKIIFENIVVRIESYSEEIGLWTGIEIQIDRIEFVDEHLEEQIKNAKETITEQPERLYTVTDLNKLLHIQGVRLYTDIWTPLRNTKLTNSQINSSDSEGDSSEMANSSFNFQSCYSHFSSRSNSNTATRPPNSIGPSPVLFAQFFSEKHTIRVRVNNSNPTVNQAGNSYFNKRIEIDIFLGGPLYIFLTPSQIAMLKDLLSLLVPRGKPEEPSKFGGLPMQQEHYNRMMDQMQGERQQHMGEPPVGTWTGTERFYDLSEHFDLNDGQTHVDWGQVPRVRTSSYSFERTLGHGNRQHAASTSTLVEQHPDFFSFSIRAPVLVAVLSHDDPLSQDSVKERSDGVDINVAVQTIVNEMAEKAEHFFKTAASLKLSKKKLQEQKVLLSNLYDGDHLRMIANCFYLAYSLTTDSYRNLMDIGGHLDECDFVECLRSEDGESKQEQIDILSLSDVNRGGVASTKSVLNFRLKNSPEKQHDYVLNIDMENCKSELDPSLVDRISNIIFIQPFFSLYKIGNQLPADVKCQPGLDDKIFSKNFHEKPPFSIAFKCHCSNWTLKLRIPIADFSPSLGTEPEHCRRKLHPEYLSMEMEGAELEMPKSLVKDLAVHALLNMQCKTAQCTFVGDPSVLECTKEQMTFFCAETTNAEKAMGKVNGIKLTLNYDNRNKSLSRVLLHCDDMTRSLTESIFNQNDREKIEGPFSTKDTFHFKDGSNSKASDQKNDGESSQKLIKAGNRQELEDFADECRSLSNFLVDITVSQLNLAFPSRKFFEMLYNRVAYDLALFQPKSPKFYACQSDAKESRQFMECQSAFSPSHEHEEQELDSNSDDLSSERTYFSRKSSSAKAFGKKKNKESHNLSIGIRVERARLLLQNSFGKEETNQAFISQFGTELSQGYFFFVYGYRGDLNLSYFFSTSTSAELFHKNLLENESPFGSNVVDAHSFALPRQREDIFLNDMSKIHAVDQCQEDNLVISMKMHFHPETNTKDVLLTLGLQNSLLHFRPFSNINLFWAKQFAGFFTVDDYGVSGYVPPVVNIDLRVHFANIFIVYDHSCVVPNSPFELKLEIGSSYVSSYLVQNIERVKFDCIFEDIKLWMRKKTAQKVKFETVQKRFCGPTSQSVKMLMADSIHFVLAYSVLFDRNPMPNLDFACADQNLTLWLCSDTIVEFLNVLKELAYSDTVQSLFASLKPSQHEQQKETSATTTTNPVEMQADEPGTATGNIDNVPNPKTGIRRNVSVNEEKRLIREMEAAINDMPSIYHTNKKRAEAFYTEETSLGGDDTSSSPQSTTSENTDDEFILIEVPARRARPQGIGVTQMGNRFQTQFDSGNDFEFVTTQINLSSVAANEEVLGELPTTPMSILISFKMNFSSLTIFLFGGSDFSDSRTAVLKTYSTWDMNRDWTVRQEVESQGGRCRDPTVFVEIKFTRLSSVWKLFDEKSPYLSTFLLELGDFSIIDHLNISQINEMVHRLELQMQPRSSAPFLKIFLKEDQLREAVLKISLAPIRANLDQDTIDFLFDFHNTLSHGLKNVFDMPTAIPQKKSGEEEDDDVPVMEVPKAASNSPSPTENNEDEDCMNTSIYPDLPTRSSLTMSFNELKERDEEEQSTNLDERFSEEDVNLSDSVFRKYFDPSKHGEQQPDQEMEPNDNAEEAVEEEEEASTAKPSYFDTSSVTSSSKGLAAKEMFIKDFTFSPACHLRIDYEAKQRIRSEHLWGGQQGAFVALLLGTTNLKKAELVLKRIHCEKGLNIRKCAQYVHDEWQSDIIDNQLRGMVGSIAMINALVQLGQGFRDLIALPLEEYQRQDGQMARGFQKGTSSFGLNTTTAAIDTTQRVVNLLQNVAQLTYDLLNPNFNYRSENQRMQIPGDLREGFSLAYSTVREGFVDTAQTWQNAAEQDRAQGGWGMGILRQITPTALRPIVVASKATSHVLGGLKNQLRPEEHKEEMRKWRHNATGRQEHEKFRRQSSSNLIGQSSSSSPSTSRTYDIHASGRKNW